MKKILGAALLTTLFAFLHVPVVNADCDSKLVNTAWDCDFTCNIYEPGSTCISVGHFGPLSLDFDLSQPGFDGVDGCVCQSSGSINAPKYDSSPSKFLCSETNFPSSFLGTVSAKTMTLQYTDAFGGICLYKCKKRTSSCF